MSDPISSLVPSPVPPMRGQPEPFPEGVEDLRPWFVCISELTCDLDWPTYWGNDRPVQLDIGCGRGLFLYNASLRDPETNWLGIETDFTEGRRAGRRLMKRAATNARVFGGDAFTVLRTMLRPQSVEAVHVYFPDPWWKPRHRRRRIFTDEFVGLCANVLQPGGLFHAWTDVGEYFDLMRALLDHHEHYEPLPPPPEHTPTDENDYQTSFERKKRKLGCTIHRGLWRRRP